MTDKILEMAKEVRVSKQTIQSETGKIVYEEFSFNSEQLEAFANLIRADEREQCANLCKRYVLAKFPAASIESAIRERGK
jgi:hypothetical protein